MNEITRIHIAKVPYDIEINAKKELEKYIEKLTLYADDSELLADIEIRITELLTERRVEKDGIITSQDVEAIRQQLGDPKEFLGDGDIAVGDDETDRPRRRLYRDPDMAIVGGVLSGMATYFDTNPLWTRLIFIILLFVSFGTALILYLILWVITPPARTAAEKLELAGKPITLASIKALSDETGSVSNHTPKVMQTILVYCAGITMIGGALISLALTVFAATTSRYWIDGSLGNLSTPTWTVVTAGILFVISGILLTILFAIFARAIFTRRWTKKVGVTVTAVIASGILLFGAGCATLIYGQWQWQSAAQRAQHTSSVSLPATFAHVTHLAVTSDSSMMAVRYIADGQSRYELTAASDSVKPSFTVNGDSAVLTFKMTDTRRSQYIQPLLTIHGPVLASLNADGGMVSYYHDQDTLKATATGGSLNITGTYHQLIATTQDVGATIDLSGASVTTLTADTQFGTIHAGVIRDITLTQPEACPSRTTGSFSADAITSGTITYNGSSRSTQSFTTSCGIVSIGEDND